MEKKVGDEIEEGTSDFDYKIVVKLLEENASVEYIKNVTGMTIEEILKIKNKA